MVELVDTLDLGSSVLVAWGFESLFEHPRGFGSLVVEADSFAPGSWPLPLTKGPP